jgi:hypothetical protein
MKELNLNNQSPQNQQNMKKLIFISVASLSIITILHSCNASSGGAGSTTAICADYSSMTVNTMKKEDVLDMVSNYYNKQYNAINADNSIDFPAAAPLDSREVFFNLDTLKRLIYFIEKATANFSAADKANLGMNVYFGSYPQHMDLFKNGINYTNRQTLIFIPSIFDNVLHVGRDFDLNNSLNGTNILAPLYIDSVFLTTPAITIIPGMYFRYTNNTSLNAQNHGTGVPPPPAPTGNSILDITD